jgi:hypothetical protein
MGTKTKGGPVTKRGKQVSSRNALSHGLTAKKWINPEERESYQDFHSALIDDYKPQTVMESTLIEKLADIKVRLERFHCAEDHLFWLAREKAISPDLVVKSFGVDDQAVIDDISDHAFGIEKTNRPIAEQLFNELIRHDEDDISGWGYIRDNMPLLREYVLNQCKKEKIDIEQLISRYKPKTNQLTPVRIVFSTNNEPEPLTEEELNQSGLKVPRENFIAFIKALYKQTKRRSITNYVIESFPQREQQLKYAALPDSSEMDRLMRYRTSLERQFSKTLGELLHLIKLRAD